MKHFTLKSVLVIAVFFIGVSINNSCGESPIDNDLSSMYNSIRTLQNEVTNLKKEIKRLDSEITALQSSGNSSESSPSIKYIDGLYFMFGSPVGRIKYSKTGNDENTYEYTYDNYGRIISCTTHSVSSSLNLTGKTSYEYSDKKVIQTTITSWDSGKYPDTTSQTIIEYY